MEQVEWEINGESPMARGWGKTTRRGDVLAWSTCSRGCREGLRAWYGQIGPDGPACGPALGLRRA